VRSGAGQRQPHTHPEAVEGLVDKGTLAKSVLLAESTAAVGTGEEAHWQRQRVVYGEGGLVKGVGEKLLPEAFLHLPEVGSLPGEGGAMDEAQRGKPLCVVPSDVAVDTLVGIYTEELSENLYSADLRIRKLRSGTALADATPLSRSSIRQKTATMKVLRSIRRPPLCSVLLG
jgi:hypothetical protein